MDETHCWNPDSEMLRYTSCLQGAPSLFGEVDTQRQACDPRGGASNQRDKGAFLASNPFHFPLHLPISLFSFQQNSSEGFSPISLFPFSPELTLFRLLPSLLHGDCSCQITMSLDVEIATSQSSFIQTFSSTEHSSSFFLLNILSSLDNSGHPHSCFSYIGCCFSAFSSTWPLDVGPPGLHS